MIEDNTSAPKADALPGCATPRTAEARRFPGDSAQAESVFAADCGGTRQEQAREVPEYSRSGRPGASATLPRKPSLTDPSLCVLYFIAGAGLIKIGITTNLTSRFRAIRNSSPVPLELLATMPGCSAIEGLTHSRFSALRRHGEWFEDDGSIREHILLLASQPSRKVTIPEASSLLRPLSVGVV